MEWDMSFNGINGINVYTTANKWDGILFGNQTWLDGTVPMEGFVKKDHRTKWNGICHLTVLMELMYTQPPTNETGYFLVIKHGWMGPYQWRVLWKKSSNQMEWDMSFNGINGINVYTTANKWDGVLFGNQTWLDGTVPWRVLWKKIIEPNGWFPNWSNQPCLITRG